MATSCIVPFAPGQGVAFRTGVSLHSHSSHSLEYLEFLPGWASKRPVLSRLARRELARRERRDGQPLDFSRAYWRPPLSPRAVLQSESGQIARLFDLPTLVSITDHDSVDAGIALRTLDESSPHPVSVEWTIRFRGTTIHLGVHNLPSDGARSVMTRMRACTARGASAEFDVGQILAGLHALPSVLVVLNHPLWNARHDTGQNRGALDAFVALFRDLLHATEINGFRKPAENAGVVELARMWDLPVLAGGDRHGCSPNAMVNLSHADTFDTAVRRMPW
jgi:hypothetical protein